MDIQSPATSPSTRRAPMEYDAATGNVVLFGGDVSYSLPALSETWTWSQVYTTIRPPECYAFGMVFDPAAGPLVYGGLDLGDLRWC
jgi:hypothetical protein